MAIDLQTLQEEKTLLQKDFDEMKRSSVGMKDFKSFRTRTQRAPDNANEGPALMQI